MKKLLILLMFFACSCSKEEQPATVTVNRYASPVLFANDNEPKRNYFYVYEGEYPALYVARTTDLEKPAEELQFWKEPFPVDVLKNGARLNDVQVRKDIVFKNKGINKP